MPKKSNKANSAEPSLGDLEQARKEHVRELKRLEKMTDRQFEAFKRNFELPKRTTHIAFSYDGTAREDGSKSLQKKGNAIEHGFQHSPFR